MLDEEEEMVNETYCDVVRLFCNLDTLLLRDMREEQRKRFGDVKAKLKESIALLSLHYEDKERYQ